MRVPLAGRRPLLQDVRALIGQVRQTALHRLHVVLGVAPLLQRQIETVDVRLEMDEALLEFRSLRMHVCVAQMIVQNAVFQKRRNGREIALVLWKRTRYDAFPLHRKRRRGFHDCPHAQRTTSAANRFQLTG